MVRYTIRAVAAETRDLQRVISVMNRTLFEEPTTSTLTAVLMKISLGPSSNPCVTTCAAGHPLPRLVGPDGTVRTVGDPGTLLGAFANPETTQETIYLQERASIVLLTDGITDSRQAGEYYDERRLHERLAAWSGFPPAHVAEGLVDDCIEFQGGVARDDLAVVVVQHQ